MSNGFPALAEKQERLHGQRRRCTGQDVLLLSGKSREVFFSSFYETNAGRIEHLHSPTHFTGAYHTLGKGMKLLEGIDVAFMKRFPFNRIGDHFLIVLKHAGNA